MEFKTGRYSYKNKQWINVFRLYGYKFSRIVEHRRNPVDCNVYASEGYDCAPEKFWKYHKDTIIYSNLPFTYKLGVHLDKY